MIKPDGSIRCDSCNKKLGEYMEGKLRIVCPSSRCKRFNFIDLTKVVYIAPARNIKLDKAKDNMLS